MSAIVLIGRRVPVDDELRIASHPEVFALGDIAAITDAKPQQVLPRLGSVALRSGAHVGETIASQIAGRKTKPFKTGTKGTMATMGRGAAVVQMLGGKTMKGKEAQLAWGTVRPRAAAHQRRPCEGRGRLGRRHADAPAFGPVET